MGRAGELWVGLGWVGLGERAEDYDFDFYYYYCV